MSKIIKATARIHGVGAAINRAALKFGAAVHDITEGLHHRTVQAHVSAESVKIAALTKSRNDTLDRHVTTVDRIGVKLSEDIKAAYKAHTDGLQQLNRDTDVAVTSINDEIKAATAKRAELRALVS